MTVRRDEKRLGRLHRVRSLQLDLARAEEMAAADQASSAVALERRIAALSQDVAPQPGTNHGLTLFAAAHYRQRLAKSQVEAQRRVHAANRQLSNAQAATGTAKQNQGAIEKLIERELDAQAADARRALQDAPHPAQALARSLLRSG